MPACLSCSLKVFVPGDFLTVDPPYGGGVRADRQVRPASPAANRPRSRPRTARWRSVLQGVCELIEVDIVADRIDRVPREFHVGGRHLVAGAQHRTVALRAPWSARRIRESVRVQHVSGPQGHAPRVSRRWVGGRRRCGVRRHRPDAGRATAGAERVHVTRGIDYPVHAAGTVCDRARAVVQRGTAGRNRVPARRHRHRDGLARRPGRLA